MTKRDVLRNVALVLALLTAIGAAWYLIFVPYTLRVAVAPAASEPAQFFTALAHALDREKAPVRLTVLAYPDTRQTAAAIDSGKADLAVVRSDLALPTSGEGVAILHQFMVVLAARPDAEIARFSDLRERKVGVFSQGPGNRTLFEGLAAFYGLTPETITIVPLVSPDEIGKATASREIDALFMAGPRGGRGINRAIRTFQETLGAAPVLIPIHDAAALVRTNPIFTATEIAPGEIRATPPLPAEASATVTFPALIVAHRSLSSKTVYEFTKQLFTLRQTLAGEYTAAARIEALPTERGSPFFVHPGAETYYDATETGFLEPYSDYLWLALFGFGGVASLATWLFSLAFPKRRELVRSEHAELVALMDAARTAPTSAEINKIERRIDQLVAQTSRLIFEGGIDSDQQPAFDLLITRLGAILETRRRELE
jgi:TRAP transporter TAXI family solute receptor